MKKHFQSHGRHQDDGTQHSTEQTSADQTSKDADHGNQGHPHEGHDNLPHHGHDHPNKKEKLLDTLFRKLVTFLCSIYYNHWGRPNDRDLVTQAVHDFFVKKICPKPIEKIEEYHSMSLAYFKTAFIRFLIDQYRGEQSRAKFNESIENVSDHGAPPSIIQKLAVEDIRNAVKDHLSPDHLAVFDHLAEGNRPIDVTRDLEVKNPRRLVADVRAFVRKHSSAV